MAWSKIDLVNELAAIHGYRAYLEICTPTTGNLYASVDRSRYVTCHRLMYRCPQSFDDGMPVDFRAAGPEIAACIDELKGRALAYDAILVDPFHDYQSSARDLAAALALLKPNGTIVVHDCLPRDEALAQPEFKDGGWCGVTYKAYLDFVLAAPGLAYCTVDTDYGCGMVRRRPLAARLTRLARQAPGDAAKPPGGVVTKWRRTGTDYAAAYRLLQAHTQPLLHLVTVEQFLAGERGRAPVLR